MLEQTASAAMRHTVLFETLPLTAPCTTVVKPCAFCREQRCLPLPTPTAKSAATPISTTSSPGRTRTRATRNRFRSRARRNPPSPTSNELRVSCPRFTRHDGCLCTDSAMYSNKNVRKVWRCKGLGLEGRGKLCGPQPGRVVREAYWARKRCQGEVSYVRYVG